MMKALLFLLSSADFIKLAFLSVSSPKWETLRKREDVSGSCHFLYFRGQFDVYRRSIEGRCIAS